MTTDIGQMMITLSQGGFIKSIPAAVYRSQHRCGRGVKGMVVRETDALQLLAMADTQDTLLLFTSRGRVFQLKCSDILVDAARTARGIAISELIPELKGERVAACVPVPGNKPELYILTATGNGRIIKSESGPYENIRKGIDLNIEKGDELVAAGIAREKDDVVLVTEQGQSIRFNVKDLSVHSSEIGIHPEDGDKLVSLDVVIRGAYLLIVTANGYGKLTPINEYKKQSPGGMGIRTLKVTETTGKIAAANLVKKTQQLMLVSKNGLVISTPVEDEEGDKRIPADNNQGLLLVRIDEGDRVAAVTAWE